MHTTLQLHQVLNRLSSAVKSDADKLDPMRLLATLTAFLRLGRLHFLLGGVVLHLLGVSIALYSGATFNLSAVLWGQVVITAIQLMTHYANDYFDLEADQKNLTPTNWSGGSRVLVEAQLSRSTALVTALMLVAVAFIANLVLSTVIQPGITTFGLLLVAQALAWFYSAPPLRLHSRGVGELTTAILVTLLTPLTGYYLQMGTVDGLLLLAVFPLCCLQFAMLLSIEFPDAAGDRHVNKRTLIVQLGEHRAAWWTIGAVLLPYVSLPTLILLGLPLPAALAIGLTAPLGGWQFWRMWRGDALKPDKWNTLAFYSIVLLMTASAAELGAFIVLLGLK